MKTIYLVTGAAGFMGTNVCAQLLERGDAVRAFVLKGDPAVKFVPKAVEIFEGDLCSAEDCEKFFAVEPGTQTVCIHCASMVTINPNYSEKLIAVNVGGIENMLNAAKNHPECKSSSMFPAPAPSPSCLRARASMRYTALFPTMTIAWSAGTAAARQWRPRRRWTPPLTG